MADEDFAKECAKLADHIDNYRHEVGTDPSTVPHYTDTILRALRDRSRVTVENFAKALKDHDTRDGDYDRALSESRATAIVRSLLQEK